MRATRLGVQIPPLPPRARRRDSSTFRRWSSRRISSIRSRNGQWLGYIDRIALDSMSWTSCIMCIQVRELAMLCILAGGGTDYARVAKIGKRAWFRARYPAGSTPVPGTMTTRRSKPYTTASGHVFYTEYSNDGSHRSVFEHRLRIEAHLGRTLSPHEIVHHINGDPADNRLENLEVMSRAAHTRLHNSKKPLAMVRLVCVLCGHSFDREARRDKFNRKRGSAGPFCSKTCAGRWGRQQQVEKGMANLRSP